MQMKHSVYNALACELVLAASNCTDQCVLIKPMEKLKVKELALKRY